jgi:hypothetical protein
MYPCIYEPSEKAKIVLCVHTTLSNINFKVFTSFFYSYQNVVSSILHIFCQWSSFIHSHLWQGCFLLDKFKGPQYGIKWCARNSKWSRLFYLKFLFSVSILCGFHHILMGLEKFSKEGWFLFIPGCFIQFYCVCKMAIFCT